MTSDPSKLEFGIKLYPAYISSLSLAEIAQLQKEKEVEAEEERQKQMLEAPVTTSFDLFSFDTDDDSFLTLCGYYYTFSRVTSKPDFKDAIIGRWGLSGYDQVFDINADGTYTRYDSRDSYIEYVVYIIVVILYHWILAPIINYILRSVLPKHL